MEDNKMYCKPAYKCGICGTEYDSVQKRMNCEMKCVKKVEEEAKKDAEEKKKAEQAARKKELDIALKKLLKLHDAYVKDYGYYEFEISENTDADHIWPSKFFHYFFG